MKNLFLLPALIAGLNLIPAGWLTAQTFKSLHYFPKPGLGIYTNSDGFYPNGLIVSGNTLYGAAGGGGPLGNGTVFQINTDGTGFTNLHIFGGYPGDAGGPNRLLLSGSTLYGTARYGGSSGSGSVFALGTDGRGFTNLHSFTATSTNSSGVYTNSDGAHPYAGLVLSGTALYGTALYGGAYGNGTVFAVDTDGTGFTNLHSFGATSTNSSGVYTNGDGAYPSELLASSDRLYGTTIEGGTSGSGSVFALNTDGTGFTVLHDGFSDTPDLVLSGNTLYGMVRFRLFRLNTDGTGFTNLLVGSDLYSSYSGLFVSSDTLYGAYAGSGGMDPLSYYSYGYLFAFNTNGTGFRNLYDFPIGVGGGVSASAGNTLYGIGEEGFPISSGSYVYSLSFTPQLTIVPSGTNVILSWPTNVAGFDYTGYTLQSAPALTGTFTNLPSATNPYTNPIAGPQQFFRLSQ